MNPRDVLRIPDTSVYWYVYFRIMAVIFGEKGIAFRQRNYSKWLLQQDLYIQVYVLVSYKICKSCWSSHLRWRRAILSINHRNFWPHHTEVYGRIRMCRDRAMVYVTILTTCVNILTFLSSWRRRRWVYNRLLCNIRSVHVLTILLSLAGVWHGYDRTVWRPATYQHHSLQERSPFRPQARNQWQRG